MKKPVITTAALTRILLILAILPVFGLNLAMAYIMFAPDSWPKPFYLAYQFPTESATEAGSATEARSATETGETTATGHNTNVAKAAAAEGNEAGYNAPTQPAPAALLEIRAGQGLMIDTGAKIVNLAEASGRRYIRVNIILEFAPTDLEYYTMAAEEKAAYVTAFTEDVNARLPAINDTIITLLSSKTFEDVYTAEGKENVRQEIMNQINSRLPEYRVIFVYFTEFVVQ